MIKRGGVEKKKSESERECVCSQIKVGKVGVVSMSRQANRVFCSERFHHGLLVLRAVPISLIRLPGLQSCKVSTAFFLHLIL